MSNWDDLADVPVYNTTETFGSNVLIVDTFNLAFRWKHQRYRSFDPEERPEPFDYEYIGTVESLAKSYSADEIILCADGPRDSKGFRSTFRNSIYPPYKVNRDDRVTTKEEDTLFSYFMEDYFELLYALEEKFKVLRFSGVEADDLAAYLVTSGLTSNYDHVWLVSSDRDWDMLVSDRVSRFNYATKANWKNVTKTGPRPKEITSENWNEHYIYPPERYLEVNCLVGEPGDNVPGVTGVGEKRAVTLLDKYGSLDNILEQIPLRGTAKYIAELNASKEQLEINKKILDFPTYCEEAIGTENIAKIKAAL